MNTEPDFSTQKVLENDRLVEDQNEKTISIFDFAEPGRPEKTEETNPAAEEAPQPAPSVSEAREEAPKAPETVQDNGTVTADAGKAKGKKILVIILTVVIAILGIVLTAALGPFGVLVFGGIPLLFIFLWPRERKGQQ